MPILILIFIFLFGLIIGSFLNCLIWRLHEKIPLTPFVKGGNRWKRSYCPKCKKQIAWYDNLPVLSFVLLKGKCRKCGQTISWQYPIVELTAGFLFVVSFIVDLKIVSFNEFPNFQFPRLDLPSSARRAISNFQNLILILRDWFLIGIMIIVFIYDLRWYLILDIITLPAGLIIFIINILLGFSWQNLLISGIIGGGFFMSQFIVSKGKWIGGGDIRLGLLIGLAFGWPGVLVAIIISYFLGSIIGLGLIAAGKKQWGSEVPLGVFLATGAVITLFWQEWILNWYFNIIL